MALDIVETTNQSFFLTGGAGTSKSTFIRYLKEKLNKNIITIAPTAVAAQNIGGMTAHSFFQLPSRPLLLEDPAIKRFSPNSEKRLILENLDLLIIDEVSMMNSNLIDAIDCSLRRNNQLPKLPFGGKQVLFVGDLFQLKPVVNGKDNEFLKDLYPNGYRFYKARVFKEMDLQTIKLTKIYRQKDQHFVNLLERVKFNFLLHNDFNILNSKLINSEEIHKMEYVITIATTNKIVNQVNDQHLLQLDTPNFSYDAKIQGDFPQNTFPTESQLKLKVGAQVIFVLNDDNKRWVNGTIGIIEKLNKEVVWVKLKDDSIHEVLRCKWDNYDYEYDFVNYKIILKVVGTFEQFPLKLSWAMTIHRCQGKTFDRVIVDFGTGVFGEGQAYVALSRVTSFNGLFLKRPVRAKDIYISQEVRDFDNNINTETSYRILKS